ncbi:MAG: hypothetical protein AAGA80_24750, partial [Cyanobacteria bacterium P01_F01_bin.143]
SKANRIAIYTRNKKKKWTKVKEITAPKNSIPEKFGYGFGGKLTLNGSTLVINVAIRKPKKYSVDKNSNKLDNTWDKYLNSILVENYSINLDQEKKVKIISMPKINNNMISSYASDGETIVFFSMKKQSGEWLSKIGLLYDEKINYIPQPKSITNSDIHMFNTSIVVKNNLLLIGSINNYVREAWLFNLKNPEREPQKIETNINASMGITVAISEEFAAVGETSGYHYYKDSKNSPRTLIKSLKNGSTKTIDGYGSLKLNKDILLRIRPRKINFPESDIIEVFRLDEDATPHLIKKRKGIKNAYIDNNLLATVKRYDSNKKICIESVH